MARAFPTFPSLPFPSEVWILDVLSADWPPSDNQAVIFNVNVSPIQRLVIVVENEQRRLLHGRSERWRILACKKQHLCYRLLWKSDGGKKLPQRDVAGDQKALAA